MCAHTPHPYILGLDIGVASLGWSIVECDPADNFRPCSLLNAGAHLFEAGTEGDIERGKDEARNVQRRTARLVRRQTWRRARRKRKLLKALIRYGLLPDPASLGMGIDPELRRPLDIDAYLKHLDYGPSGLARKWARCNGSPHTDQLRWCYLLRGAAAARPVDVFEFGRALYHLAQRRGFQSNRRADAKKSEDAGTVKQAIGELSQRIEQFAASGGTPTLGAYLASLNPDEQRLRGRWTARSMYSAEFEHIWNTQAAVHGVPDQAKEEIRKAIFWQRPLKNQAHLIGHCSLIPTEKRCPIANRRYQRFRMLQAVNHLQIAEPDTSPRFLSPEERAVLVRVLETEGDLTFARVKTLLGLKKTTAFNLERGGEKRIVGHRTDAKLRAVFGERFDAMTDAERDAVVHDLRSFGLPEALERRGARKWGLTGDVLKNFARIDLEDEYAPISLLAIERLLPAMESGLPYATARKQVFPESLAPAEPLDELPPVTDTLDELRNPAVIRALTEVRKLVNAIIRKYGKPAIIRIELAREIKNPRKVRERITRNIREREKERAAIVARIQREAGLSRVTRDDIERVLLAEECGWICPYTGRQICWDTLLGKSSQFDIEHIWPRSRSLDDSLMNKTLCYHEENRSRKRGFTPCEAYGGDPARFEEILGRIRLWKCDPFVRAHKLARFQEKAIPEGFTNRHLSDTRFIARATADYLGLLYGGRVDGGPEEGSPGIRRIQVCTGGLTAWLRSGWGIAGLLGATGEKNRTDHRHHAVDAIVIALSDARAVQTLARAATEAEQRGKARAFETIDEPWSGFRDDVKSVIDRIIVSHRQSRKVSGPLHDQSIYSRAMNGPLGPHRIRKELHKLTPSEIRDGKIVDQRALAAIRAKLEELNKPNPSPQDLIKIFADPNNAPLVKGHNGSMVRLRKVRVVADAARQVGRADKGAARWVNPKNNHHTVIVECKDAKGRVRWEDRPLALIDAYARRAAKLPIVNRDLSQTERFVFSLAPGEFVEMDVPGNATQRAIYRIASISQGDIELRLHRDGRTSDQIKKDKDRVRVSGEKLRKLRARKVRVTYLGEVVSAGG
jgi:CRISPR-associated protein Cas9/Csn1, subtype II/NMEMI